MKITWRHHHPLPGDRARHSEERLVTEAADLRILVTSLVPLELPEERRIELRPLGPSAAVERAEALLEEAGGIERESGNPLLLGYLHFIRCSVACRAGRFAEGHTRLREALP